MLKAARVLLITVSTALLLCLPPAVVVAQINPTMPSQRNDAEKEDLYARYSEHKKVLTAERQRLAYEAARDYLKRFGAEKDHYVPEMRRFVTEYESALRRLELHKAYTSKNYSRTLDLGRASLKADPGDFFVLATLVRVGFENAQGGNASLNEETIEYLRQAIAVLEAGKLTVPDPFESFDGANGFLNFALGWFLKTQAPVEAAAALVKAARFDSPYRTDPLTYNLLGIAILKGEYAQVSAEYNSKYANQLSSPEQQAMLQRVIHLGDRAIDAYARSVALSTRPEQQEAKQKMLTRLTALYKSFHNNSDAGLNELIATVLTRPLP